jgi:hypothetical protein
MLLKQVHFFMLIMPKVIVKHYLEYRTDDDLAQGTAFQSLCSGDTMGLIMMKTLSGYLHLFNPSSTTFVKHFITGDQLFL